MAGLIADVCFSFLRQKFVVSPAVLLWTQVLNYYRCVLYIYMSLPIPYFNKKVNKQVQGKNAILQIK